MYSSLLMCVFIESHTQLFIFHCMCVDGAIFFLQLFDECITNLGSLMGTQKRTFWILFTGDLNKCIKENESDFIGFGALEVMKCGKEFNGLYNKFKAQWRMLPNKYPISYPDLWIRNLLVIRDLPQLPCTSQKSLQLLVHCSN